MEILEQSPKALNKAVLFLKEGGVVVCPTDTVYGFLAGAWHKKAVERIYKIKNRPRSKPLPVFVKDLTMAKELAQISERQAKVLKKFWPGKYTFILKRKSVDVGRPRALLYGVNKKTIALRIPKYKFLNDLLKKINQPLVQTSVNISGKPPLITVRDIQAQFSRYIGVSDTPMLIIDGGNLKKYKSSKITDLTSKKLTRLR